MIGGPGMIGERAWCIQGDGEVKFRGFICCLPLSDADRGGETNEDVFDPNPKDTSVDAEKI